MSLAAVLNRRLPMRWHHRIARLRRRLGWHTAEEKERAIAAILRRGPLYEWEILAAFKRAGVRLGPDECRRLLDGLVDRWIVERRGHDSDGIVRYGIPDGSPLLRSRTAAAA